MGVRQTSLQFLNVRSSPSFRLGLGAKLGPLSAMTGHFIWYFWLLSDQLLRAKSALGHRPLTKALPILGSR